MKFVFLVLNIIFLITSSVSWANIEGGPTQNFNPVYGGGDFTTVHSSSTVKKYHLNVGLLFDYSIETLPVYPTVVNPDIDDRATYATLGLGLGLTDRWDIGISIPYILNQSVDDTQLRGQFAKSGLIEVRLLSKYRLLDFDGGGGLAVLGSIGFNQTDRLPFVGEDPGPTVNVQLLADKAVGQWLFAGNIGYRFASPGPQISGFTLFEPIGDSFIASGAARYQFNENWFALGELWAAVHDVDLGGVDRESKAYEALLGGIYKKEYESSETMSVHFGMTRQINNGISTPTMRVYAGINYMFGALWGESAPAPRVKAKKPAEPKKPLAEIPTDFADSFYNEGYRQGYMAGYGIGPYAGLGPVHGQTLDGGQDYPEGFYEGYIDGAGVYPGDPDRPMWAKCYRTGFQGKLGNGPGAGKSEEYGSELDNHKDCPEGFRTGWWDAPDSKDLNDVDEGIESYYNPGYREGYKAGYGIGPYVGMGPEHGQTLDEGFEFPEGYYDGYIDAVGPFPGDPNRRTYGQAYRTGFQGKLGNGPGAGKDQYYGASLNSEPDYVTGFEHGWIDAPDQAMGFDEPQDVQEVELPEDLPEKSDNERSGYESDIKAFTINTDEDVFKDRIPEEEERLNIENITFNTASAKITESSYPVLENLVNYLNRYDFRALEIWGHTDSRGAALYNERLSLERARSVYNYLVQQGIDGSKITFDGWGERKPVAPNTTSENLRKNRRVEFIIRR